MTNKHTMFESDKCKIDVSIGGDVTIECDDNESLTLGNTDIKMIDGISDLAKSAVDDND